MLEIKEYFKIAIRNLRARRLRSWLTILGIVVGVFLIISLLSLSQGLEQTILQQLKMMGKDVVMVFPGDVSDIMATFAGGMELSSEDLRAIEQTKGVEMVVPMVWKGESMRYQGKTKIVLLYGYPLREAQDFLKDDLGWSMEKGEWPTPGKRQIIVGNLVPKEIFPGMRTETRAYIKGKEFVIKGILKSLGSKQDDSMVGMDLPLFREITGKKKGAQFAFAKISPNSSAEEVAKKIKEKLGQTQKRKIGQEDLSFSVITNEKAGGIAGSILTVIQVVVFAFASIAIVVGGIGIMNTMFTSVRERTREIGIMKAMGAQNTDVLFIFLIEAGVIGLIGGIGGTFLGAVFGKLVETYGQVHPMFYFKASITPGLLAFGLGFSFGIGCLSGLFPATMAAKLKPVQALRRLE